MTEREKDDDSLTEKDGVKQSRRPVDTAIRQQRMKSWQPILDPFFVIVGLFVLGVVFVATGKYRTGITRSSVQFVYRHRILRRAFYYYFVRVTLRAVL